MASRVWLQPPGLYSYVSEAACLVAKSGLMVMCFGVIMASKCVLVILFKSICLFLKTRLFLCFSSPTITACEPVFREVVGVPYVLSLSSISPGLVVTTGHRLRLQHDGVPCPSLVVEQVTMLPSPVSVI